MVGKSNFTSKNIILYSPQMDRTLSISKKKMKNVEHLISLIPQKIGLKYTQSKQVVESIWVKRFLVKEI
jgi:hypothetical protein